jgi:plastocyanin
MKKSVSIRFERWERFAVLLALVAFAACACAQSVTGTILIKKKLTRKNVTADVSVYQRGTAVKLGRDSQQDPIAYERSRVVIYLEGPGLAGSDPATNAPIQIQQVDRRFSPDLAVVPAGSTVSFPNMDPIFHNVYSLSKPKTFDLGNYDKGQTRTVLFPKPGIVDIYCRLHPNMAATIVVAPNRWFAQPDRTGKYRIPDVPPGKYTIVAWHKSAGYFRKQIVIEAGRDAVADFFIPVEADSTQDAAERSVAQNLGSK